MIKTCPGIVVFSALLIMASCNNAADEKSKNLPELSTKESLKNAIREFPDSGTLVQSLVQKYRDEGSYDSALALTDMQIKKDSGNAYLWNMKATLLFENEDTIGSIK